MKTLRLFGSEGGIFDKKIEIKLPDDCVGISFACADRKKAPKGIPETVYHHLIDGKDTDDLKNDGDHSIGRIASIYYSWEPEEDDLKVIDGTSPSFGCEK